MKKENRYLIGEILYTLIFLIVSTFIWFNFKKDYIYHDVDSPIVFNQLSFNSLEKVKDEAINSLNSYSLNIKNTLKEEKEYKIIIVPNALKNNISNNYIKYKLGMNPIRSLNMDGIIYIDYLDVLETKNLNLKIWISDTYSGNLNFDGHIIVS